MNNRLFLSLVLGLSLLSLSAEAAGLFLAPRGVRPLGRAGAFVAGAVGGLWESDRLFFALGSDAGLGLRRCSIGT